MIKKLIIRSHFKSHIFSWLKEGRAEQEKINKSRSPNVEPAVAPETSKEEFEKRYSHLKLNMLVLTIFWGGGLISSISHFAQSSPVAGINLLVFSFLPLVILFKNQYIKWLAQDLYKDWSNRHLPNQKTMMDFIQALKTNPAILFKFRLEK